MVKRTRNTLKDLRDHLFATLEGLTDQDKPMEVERAKAVCNVAQQLIASAKVEVEYMDVTGNESDDAKHFFQQPIGRPLLPAKGNGTQ
jgi:hypothetical protein